MAKTKPLAVLPPIDETVEWQLAKATAKEAGVRVLEALIGTAEVAEEMLRYEGDERAAGELRQLGGLIRERRDDRRDEIRQLRAGRR